MKKLISGKSTGNYYDPRPNLANDHKRNFTDEVIVARLGSVMPNKWGVLVYSVEHTKTHGGVTEYETSFRTKTEAISAGRKIARQRKFPLYSIE